MTKNRGSAEKVRAPTAEEVKAALAEPDPLANISGPERRRQSNERVLRSLAAAEFRDPQSGRLDGARLSERLGLSLTELAAAAGVTSQLLSRQPDAPAAQMGLAQVAWAIVAAEELLGPGRIRIWLRTPLSALAGQAPLQWILDGRADMLARRIVQVLEAGPD